MTTAPTQTANIPHNDKDKGRYLKFLSQKAVEYLKQYYLQEQGWDQEELIDHYFILFRNTQYKDTKKTFAFKLRELKENPTGIIKFIEENIVKYDLYHSIFIFPNPRRVGGEAIKESKVVFIDLDKKDHSIITMKELNEKIAPILQEWFKSRRINYTIIYTGRGIHIKIVLDEALSEDEYKQLSLLCEIFKNTEFKMDNIYDFARIIRLPYSINQKSKRQVKIVYGANEITKKEDLIKLISELKKLKKAKERTEKQFEAEEVIDLEDEKLAEVVKEVYLVVKDWYKQGTRQNLFFFTLAILYKYTRIPEQELREFAEKLLDLLGDDERIQRMSVVNSLLAQEKSEGRDKIATVSFFFIQNEQGEIIEDRRLSQFAQANNLSLEEAKNAILKLKKDILEILGRKGQKYNRKFIGRVRISTSKTIVDVEVFKDAVALTFYKNTSEGLEFVGRQYFIKAKIILKEVVVKKNELKRTSEWLYTVEIISDFTREEFKQTSLKKIADYLYGSPLVRMKSKQQIETVLQAVFEVLIRYYKIPIKRISESFKVMWGEEKKKYTHNGHEFYNETYHIIDTRDYDETIKDKEEQLTKLFEILNKIQDDKVLFLVGGALVSTFFNQELRLKPLIWLWSKEAGLGKSTLMEFISEKLFGIKKLSIQEFKSDFRTISALSLATLPIILDDISRIDRNTIDFIKAYLTGVKSVVRGRSDLTTTNIDLKGTLFVTSNNKIFVNEDAFRDRAIQLKIVDYIFDSEEAVYMIDKLQTGVGYILIDECIDVLNSFNKKFSEFVDEMLEALRSEGLDNININHRRKKLYAQLVMGFSLLGAVASEYHQKFHNRSLQIRENIIKIIEEIELMQSDIDDAILFIDDIIEEIRKKSYVKKTDKGQFVVTRKVFNLLREEVKLLNDITNLKDLEVLINYKYKHCAKTKTVRIGGEVVYGLVIEYEEIKRIRELLKKHNISPITQYI